MLCMRTEPFGGGVGARGSFAAIRLGLYSAAPVFVAG